MPKIRIAIAGIGNCASALIQGLTFYRDHDAGEVAGLMHPLIGRWRATDIEVVAAFDIDRRKVGQPLEKAIFEKPNCARVFQRVLSVENVIVQMGPVLDGVADHMADYDDAEAFRPADAESVDVARQLEESGAEVLLCYLPVGSERAVRHYAEACLAAKVAMVNCMPVFIASDPDWGARFRDAGLPIVGDDIKSQVGATIVHRALSRLFNDRGVALDRTYQLNTGGNTDFLNMLQRDRLRSKKLSKTESVQSQLDCRLADRDIHIGPSDYVPWQGDNKICFIRMEGRGFGDLPLELELRLSVQDSPNSAGVVIDALRCAKLGLERGLGGPLVGPCAYYMKSPPVQMRDTVARDLCHAFIDGRPAAATATAPATPAAPAARAVRAAGGRAAPGSALILAAGMGLRLFPNASLPKPLAPICGVTMAERVVRTLRAAIGVNRFVVSLGHESETVRSHFLSVARRNGVEVAFVEAADWAKGNGASALAAAEVIGEEPFILSMCDHLYDDSLPARLVEAPPAAGEMLLAVDFDKTGLWDADGATKVKTDGANIVAIAKSLSDWDGADCGVMHCTAGLFDALRAAAKLGRHGLSDGLALMARRRGAHSVDVTGCWWVDVDTPAVMQIAHRHLAERLPLTG